jgi:hypothetical protein
MGAEEPFRSGEYLKLRNENAAGMLQTLEVLPCIG